MLKVGGSNPSAGEFFLFFPIGSLVVASSTGSTHLFYLITIIFIFFLNNMLINTSLQMD